MLGSPGVSLFCYPLVGLLERAVNQKIILDSDLLASDPFDRRNRFDIEIKKDGETITINDCIVASYTPDPAGVSVRFDGTSISIATKE